MASTTCTRCTNDCSGTPKKVVRTVHRAGSLSLATVQEQITPVTNTLPPTISWFLWMVGAALINEFSPVLFSIIMYGGSIFVLPWHQYPGALTICICHGLAHALIPTIDSKIGYNRMMAQYPDQFVHLAMQLYWHRYANGTSIRFVCLKWILLFLNLISLILSFGTAANEAVSYAFEWVSFFPALASGLFIAELMGDYMDAKPQIYKIIICFTIIIYWDMKLMAEFFHSNWMVLMLARARFFESYFMGGGLMLLGYHHKKSRGFQEMHLLKEA